MPEELIKPFKVQGARTRKEAFIGAIVAAVGIRAYCYLM
jgi:hypothetical protein